MEPSDEALVSACRSGDSAAWETLSARYRGLIYNIGRRAGLDQEQAADVCQNVFVTLVRKLDHIEQPAQIRAWLLTTTRHEVWKLRQRERVSGMAMSYDAYELDALTEDVIMPDEQLLRLEQQHTVRAGVALLDERCRTLLTLLFYRRDPAPYAEIATTLGMPEGSIGPIRGRCLQKLRRILNRMRS
jgi:RNA polymerase sigma factor (sigma-70 family)